MQVCSLKEAESNVSRHTNSGLGAKIIGSRCNTATASDWVISACPNPEHFSGFLNNKFHPLFPPNADWYDPRTVNSM